MTTVKWPKPPCRTCGVQITGRRLVYCSRRCADRYYATNRRPELPACWFWPLPDTGVYEMAFDRAALGIMADWQRHRCAICGYSHSRLVRDHDHATGLWRGLLCGSCNAADGKLPTSAPFAAYSERHPTTLLGLEVRFR